MDSQIDLITYKKYLLLAINTIKFLLFRIKYIIDEGCLFDDLYIQGVFTL